MSHYANKISNLVLYMTWIMQLTSQFLFQLISLPVRTLLSLQKPHFWLIKLMFVVITRLLFDLCSRCESSAFFCSYLCSPWIFVSAERGEKCKSPRNHLSAHFHSRRFLFGLSVCGDTGRRGLSGAREWLYLPSACLWATEMKA